MVVTSQSLQIQETNGNLVAWYQLGWSGPRNRTFNGPVARDHTCRLHTSWWESSLLHSKEPPLPGKLYDSFSFHESQQSLVKNCQKKKHFQVFLNKKNWSQSFSPTISSTSRLDQHVHPTAPWDEAPSSPGRTRQEAHRIILGEKRTQLENWKLPHSAAADLRTIFALRENWIVLGQSLIPGMLENCNWTLGGGGCIFVGEHQIFWQKSQKENI